MPQEIDISTLQTLGNWDLSRAWNRPFTSHPKRVLDTGELVTIGIAPSKPYLEIGVISADGKNLVHRANLKLNRCPICHDIGITKSSPPTNHILLKKLTKLEKNGQCHF